MRAWQIDQAFGISNLRLRDLPAVPLKRHQIRCRVLAIALNYRDLLMVTGAYNPRQPLPLTPCSDACLEVIEVGEDVHDFVPGDRVLPSFSQGWLAGKPSANFRKTTLGGPLPGTLAEEITLDASGVVAAPPHLSPEEAATLPCAAVTAWRALTVEGDIRAGDTVLTIGTGGVSCFTIQLAHMLGARVIVTSRSQGKLDKIASLGADACIVSSDTPQWGKAASALAGDGGVDLVVELGGAGTLSQSLHAVRPGGTIALIGVLDGVKTDLLVTRITMAAVRVQGVLVGSCSDLADLCRAMRQHPHVKSTIGARYDFTDAPEAFAQLAKGEHIGKIVIGGASS